MIVGKSFLFLANPRTGTGSVHAALKGHGDVHKFPHHSKAFELYGPGKIYKPTIPNWNDLFKFTFIRNPLDYWVSHYNWMNKGNFKEMALSLTEDKAQYHYCCLAGKLAVDFLGKFERLVEDFKKICDIIGIKAELPHLQKTEHRPYMDYYDKETEGYIKRVFRKDFEVWES